MVASSQLVAHHAHAPMQLDYDEHRPGKSYGHPHVSRIDGRPSPASSSSSSHEQLDSYHTTNRAMGDKHKHEQATPAVFFHQSDHHQGDQAGQLAYSFGRSDGQNYENYEAKHRQLGARGSAGAVCGLSSGNTTEGEDFCPQQLQQHRHSYHNQSLSYMTHYSQTGSHLAPQQLHYNQAAQQHQQQQQTLHQYEQQGNRTFLGQNHPYQSYQQNNIQDPFESRLYSSQLNIHMLGEGGKGGESNKERTNEFQLHHRHGGRLVASSGQLVGPGSETNGASNEQSAKGRVGEIERDSLQSSGSGQLKPKASLNNVLECKLKKHQSGSWFLSRITALVKAC